MSQPHAEAIDVRPDVSCTPYSTSSRGETGDIIMFAQFEEGSLLSETHDSTESSNKSDYDSTMPPLSIKEEMDVMSSVDESDDEPMSKKMLEDICDGSKSHTIVNMREACYKIRDRIKRIQTEWKGALLST